MIINDKEHFSAIIEKLISLIGYTEIKRENSEYIDFTAVKDGKKYCFVCKYDIDAISGKKMEDFIEASSKLGNVTPVFVTNSSFSSTAKKLGDSKGVELWDRNFVDRLAIGIDAPLEDETIKKKSSVSPVMIAVVAVLVVIVLAVVMFYLKK